MEAEEGYIWILTDINADSTKEDFKERLSRKV